MNTKFIAGIAAAVVLVATVGLLTGGVGPQGPKGDDGRVGASVGPDHTNLQNFFSNFTIGGDAGSRYATTSTAATYALTATEVRKKNSLVTWTPNVNTTLTSMASTSAPLSGMKVGETFTQTWYNASSTAASTITFAAGTGVDAQELEGGSLIVNGLEGATLTFIKKADTDVMMLVAPWQVAD